MLLSGYRKPADKREMLRSQIGGRGQKLLAHGGVRLPDLRLASRS